MKSIYTTLKYLNSDFTTEHKYQFSFRFDEQYTKCQQNIENHRLTVRFHAKVMFFCRPVSWTATIQKQYTFSMMTSESSWKWYPINREICIDLRFSYSGLKSMYCFHTIREGCLLTTQLPSIWDFQISIQMIGHILSPYYKGRIPLDNTASINLIFSNLKSNLWSCIESILWREGCLLTTQLPSIWDFQIPIHMIAHVLNPYY